MLSRQQIGFRLRSVRKESHLTQQTVADHLGISRVLVSFWENGKRTLSVGSLYQLSKIYHYELSYFLDEGIPENARPKVVWCNPDEPLDPETRAEVGQIADNANKIDILSSNNKGDK